MRKFIISSLLLISSLCFAQNALALESGSVSVAATVEPIRLVYVSSRTEVVKIETNTSNNIPPTIVDDKTHQPIPPTPKILAQYQGVINSHGSLSTGTYWPPSKWLTWLKDAAETVGTMAVLVLLLISINLGLNTVETINCKPNTYN